MLLKTPSPHSQQLSLIPIINRIRVRASGKKSRSPSHSIRSRKNSSPKINKSFAAYEDVSPLARIRNNSLRRQSNSSVCEMKSFRSRKQKFKSEVVEDLFNTFDSHIETAKDAIRDKQFLKAKGFLKEILMIDHENVAALYNKAICHANLHEYESAISDFHAVFKLNPKYSKNAYLEMSKCYAALNDINSALKWISNGLSKFPKFSEGYIDRGYLFLKQGRYEKALKDFAQALKQNFDKAHTFLAMADCFSGIGDNESAIKILTKALALEDCPPEVALKRAKIYNSIGNFTEAIEDLDLYLSLKPDSSEANFEKGLMMLKINKISDATLCFEQCIKFDKERSYLSQAIFHLGTIKIKEKDFYGALYTFKRINSEDEDQSQKSLRIYAESVIELIKRNFEVGIKSFSKLIKRNDSVINEYLSSCYNCRAYGYIMQRDYDKALKDFRKSCLIAKLDRPSKFNQCLCLGMKLIIEDDVKQAAQQFKKAHKLFPRNPDPYILNASLLLCHVKSENTDHMKTLKMVNDLVEKALKGREHDYEILYYRAIIKYLNKDWSVGLDSVNNAISESENNDAEHYLLRGLIYASLGLYKEAIDDFSVCCQIDESFKDAYYYRARCLFLSGDSNKAFEDFQKYINENNDDPQTHIQAGNIFMIIGSVQDAINAFNFANSLSFSYETSYQIGMCQIILNNLDEAYNELLKVSNLKPSKSLQQDIAILKYLKELLEKPFDKANFQRASNYMSELLEDNTREIFDNKSLRLFKGVFLMYSELYDQAIYEFQTILDAIQVDNIENLPPEDAISIEEENCEVLYNIAVCNISLNPNHALLIFQDLSEILNNQHRGSMLFLAGVVEKSLNNTESSEKYFNESLLCDPSLYSNFSSNESSIVLPLNTSNPFALLFPLIDLPFKNLPKIQIRPSISLPRIKVPVMKFEVEEKAKQLLSVEKLKLKLEAPWLNRVHGSIQFTDEVITLENEPSDGSEEETAANVTNVTDFEATELNPRKIKSMTPLKSSLTPT
ncbi:unnamed protein product [Blepharisma stoltei]|uniref:TPR-like protein n=1 Tax=Blepharisma stoltei TaxID=1481888 RepID=A0AAU9I9F4_9CILI|nr:unnamed protein product [Blepharisma stoltei]